MHGEQRMRALAGLVEIVERIIVEHMLEAAPGLPRAFFFCHRLSLLRRHQHQLLVRDVEVLLAYIERQLPGSERAELRKQDVRTGRCKYVWDVDSTLSFEDLGDGPAVEAGVHFDRGVHVLSLCG